MSSREGQDPKASAGVGRPSAASAGRDHATEAPASRTRQNNDQPGESKPLSVSSVFNALRHREDGLPRRFSAGAARTRSAISNSTDMIHRMELQRTLDGHGGCVNTVSFNPTGDLLISGSDDQSVMLWDWRRGVPKLRFEPGHTNNIFQARMLPGTCDRTLVSCAADGQVRVTYFRDGSSRPNSKRLHRHQGRAHKLALQHVSPYDSSGGTSSSSYGGGSGGPPCFYSSGEDGDVCFYDLRVTDSEPLGRMAATAGGPSSMSGGGTDGGRRSAGPSPRPRPRQVIDLNAVHVNPARPWQLVVGGADEAVLVYDNRLLTSLSSSYTSSSSPSIAAAAATSYGGGSPSTANSRGTSAAATGVRCQRVHGRPLLELCPSHLRVTDPSAFRRPTHVTCVMFGQNGDVLATYNDDDVYLFRPPGTQGSGGGEGAPGSRCGGVDSSEDDKGDDEDDSRGDGLHRGWFGFGRRRSGGGGGGGGRGTRDANEDESFLRPSQRRRRCGGGVGGSGGSAGGSRGGTAGRQRSNDGGEGGGGGDCVIGRYSGHRNNRTVKGVSFLGEREEWVVSGSDCGHIYIWYRATGRLHAWLRGDSYVVNCLEPHPHLPLHMATSGINHDIKLWAPTSELPRPPGSSAQATMRENVRQRAAAQSRSLGGGGGGRVVLPPAVLQALLGELSRDAEEDEEGGDGSRSRELQSLLMAALRDANLAGLEDSDEDDEDDEDDEGDEDDEDDEGDKDEEEGSDSDSDE